MSPMSLKRADETTTEFWVRQVIEEACAPLEAEIARLSRIEEAARALLDITDCYARPFIPSAVWVKADALRAALEEKETP